MFKTLKFKMANGADCIFEVFLDEEYILHILDLNYENTMTVTNAIDELFLKKIYDKIYINPENIKRIFLYGTDGIVSEWDYGFNFIDIEKENCCDEFVSYMKKYKNKRRERIKK